MAKRKLVIFIIPYPINQAASQRFRFEQYFHILQSNAIDYSTQTFLTSSNWKVFYQKGNYARKARAILLGFWRRMGGLFAIPNADFVFIHREAAPIGPPIFEWIITKIFRKKIIYDFDDALWMTDRSDEPIVTRFVKWRGKVASICQWSHVVSAGNTYLCAYASKFARSVVLNPTTIETTGHHHPKLVTKITIGGDEVVVGWTGSHSTLKYLEALEPVLRQLEVRFPNIRILVIADKPPKMKLQHLMHIPWNEETEIEDLAKFDIGVMPLPDNEWAMGKCGFKILQYMALCIPSVSSPVGVNTSIVEHGGNGFLADSEQDWVGLLSLLIENPNLRHEIGVRGRQTVVQRYSVNSNTSTFLSLFE